jgi:quercetin dioxygenase-like cupin family protein
MDKLSLTAQARNELDSARRAASGRSAKTVHGGHDKVLRQTVVALCAGRATDSYESPGEGTVQVLVGRIRLQTATTTWDGAPGDLIVMPQTRTAMHAVEDAVVLLTVAKA